MRRAHCIPLKVRTQQYLKLVPLLSLCLLVMGCFQKEPPTVKPLPQQELDKKLILAVKQDDVEQVKALLKQGASPNAHQVRTWKLTGQQKEEVQRKKLKDFPTPSVLHIALGVWEEADPDYKRTFNVLALAPREPDPGVVPFNPNPVVVRLLVEAGANVNEYAHELEKDHVSPIRVASAHFDLDMIEFFIQKGAKLNDSSPISTALLGVFSQITVDRSNILEALLKHGADPNKGFPLRLTYGPGQLNYIRLLVKYGANVNATNEKGETILRQMKRAVKEGTWLPPSQDVIDLLEKMGAKDEVVKLPKKSGKKTRN